ncbi:hypothetical protein NitYY0826_C0510 [Nitratiruptor sp. YY08-26]|uniref:hypothetical protein n=1 Tax=unclassified Nitratiruptor TaxID=2624044 RepID=UPI001915C77E|nr:MULTISPECIES: hypothetical protein [unclassified Nitratiruptor]BCD61649.1 hypothetical protein NitYY0813_C0508 [Nitratiruptor sp. YY08-13]BCD65584.1 hypothetical protein NitYY0826_C0510 [Nitratiruptor sp. YY08-26]
MRLAGFIIKNGRIYEILPKTCYFESISERRRLFFEIINFTMPKSFRFNLQEYDFTNQNIAQIFMQKIVSLLPFWETALLFLMQTNFQFLINLDKVFLYIVYKRILKKNPKKFVSIQPPFIYIDNGKRKVRIHPLWKSNFNKTTIEKEIQIMEKNVEHYIVLPKQNYFYRYKSIYHQNCEILRIVPYSFSFFKRAKAVS